jgi:hypothetical protein
MKTMFSFNVGKYLEAKLLGHMVNMFTYENA